MKRAGSVVYDCLGCGDCALAGGRCLCPRRVVAQEFPDRPGPPRPPLRADVLAAPKLGDQFPGLRALRSAIEPAAEHLRDKL